MYRIFQKILIRFIKLFLVEQENLKLYGTQYGGMVIQESEDLRESYILSAGSGEDLTFDIELINKFNCKIYLIDPTPRAIKYYQVIVNNFGSHKEKEYSGKGFEDPGVYDLSNVNKTNLKLIKKALFINDNLELNFYEPPNSEHVSYSLENWQGNYSKKSKSIIVKSITIKSIMRKEKIENISLLKLDIEGSEVEVLKNMLKDKIYPNQLAVEFSNLWNKQFKTTFKFIDIFIRLLKNGYQVVDIRRYPNFLFIRK
tara:strand:- start:1780 stop:2547 length:768 start_codon:yes stop_codon:yes gene_type:complete